MLPSPELRRPVSPNQKKYWHPHNGEILSGQLVGPNIPIVAEKALMTEKMKSYGKIWHVWNTGFFKGNPGDSLPLGKPMLAWSFNRDGEATPGLVEERDRKMGLNSTEIRKKRAELRKIANPQSGVDALKGKFGRTTEDIPGVTDKKGTSNQSNGDSR